MSLKVVVTGGAGFIGSALIPRLARAGASVRAIDIREPGEELGSCAEWCVGDVRRQRDVLARWIDDADVVVPLAAVLSPKVVLTRPVEQFEIGMLEPMWMIDRAVASGARVVWPSSSEVYGIVSDDRVTEGETRLVYGPIGEHRWAYACAKQTVDRYLYALALTNEGFGYVAFRPFNWSGPGSDSLEAALRGEARVVTQMCADALVRRVIRVVDGGMQRRTLMHIDDGARALSELVLRQSRSSTPERVIVNMGNAANDTTIMALAAVVAGEAGDDVVIEDVPSRQFYGKGHADSGKCAPSMEIFERELGWLPKKSIVEIVRDVIAWLGPQVEERRVVH